MIYVLFILLNHPNSEAKLNSKITGAYYTGISLGNVVNPHQGDADTDSACHFDSDPDLLVPLIRIRILPCTLM
jgi:hypothetical protein